MEQAETKDPTRYEDPQPDGPPESRTAQLGLGFLFGVIFGFLLQKGGVAKYEVLIGFLLLEDFTVVKVMGSAVVVGMIGVYVLHTVGLVNLHVKPTRYGANTLGGILFGIGFGLAAYCPGTGAAALGQGNFDAIAVLLGLMAGSYVFAELSGWLARTVNRWGDRGVLTADRLLNLRPRVLVPVVATVLAFVLAAIHVFVDPTP
ncbi:MAG TPA: DUF6691 family protein [Methylomirabilota bacterium]|nr:DUF6691 family protein [Methylomirabilota bacterium]